MPTMLFRMDQPEELVRELVYNLPEWLFISDSATFFDPAMGKGDYLVMVAERLKKYGHSKDNILSRLTGFETNGLYIENCKHRTPIGGANISIKTYEEVLKWEPEMKFDCVISNVPFNDSSSSRNDTNRRQGGRIITREFINLAIRLAAPTAEIVIISAVSKIWSGASKSRNFNNWRNAGLYKVTNVSRSFRSVDSSLNIGCFFFSMGSVFPSIEDHWKAPPALKNNLAKYWRGAQGTDRRIIRDMINDEPNGKFRVFETAAVVLKTNDEDAFNRIESRPWDDTFRVVFSKIRTDKIGRVAIASPGDKLSGTASCVVCRDYEHAVKMKAHLESKSIVEMAMEIKDLTSDYNGKFLFERLPDFE